jgi:hypothetical protein
MKKYSFGNNELLTAVKKTISPRFEHSWLQGPISMLRTPKDGHPYTGLLGVGTPM